MGMPEIRVNASFAFVLGVKEPQKQVEVLSTLVALISDKAAMERLEGMTSEQKISDMLNDFFETNMGGL
jgi:PTS system galactitol-specific IIA component